MLKYIQIPIQTMMEFMSQGGFVNKSETTAWDFLEDIAKKILQWWTFEIRV